MFKKLELLFSAAILVLAMVSFAQAYTTYFGEDLGSGESTRLSSHPNADGAAASFLSKLTGVGTETFESYGAGTSTPLAISFPGAGTATLSGNGSISTVTSGTNGVGRYPISGDNFWEASNVFSINFSAPVAAFGFYGIDIGDFGGQVTLTLVSGGTKQITVPNTMNGVGGGVLYFGVIDTEDPFSAISFGNTESGTDFFGFDDMTIGSIEQVRPTVPEPSTMLLLGAGMAGLVFIRRKRA